MKTRECVVEPIKREWRNIGIPETAQSLGESYIGSSQIPWAGLLTNNWFGEYETQSNDTIKYMFQFTNHLCLPGLYLKLKIFKTLNIDLNLILFFSITSIFIFKIWCYNTTFFRHQTRYKRSKCFQHT